MNCDKNGCGDGDDVRLVMSSVLLLEMIVALTWHKIVGHLTVVLEMVVDLVEDLSLLLAIKAPAWEVLDKAFASDLRLVRDLSVELQSEIGSEVALYFA